MRGPPWGLLDYAHDETKRYRWYDRGVSSGERRLEQARWPEGVRCPRCGSADITDTAPRRRCRACRRPFRWSAQTALHATKLSAEQWIAAAASTDLSPQGIAATLGVSAPTARRVAALLEAADSPSSSPDERLRRLLAQAPPLPRRSRPRDGSQRTAAVMPRGVQRLVESLTHSERRVINALRHRPFGVTAHSAAELAGVSVGHTRRCLGRIEGLGWAHSEPAVRAWGYRQLRLRLWKLTWSDSCAAMLGLLPATRPVAPPERFPDMVPPEFWFSFWSGTPADELRISTDGLLIAETLIGGNDPVARIWALSELPLGVLEQCRSLRGCDTGPNAADIDAMIGARRG